MEENDVAEELLWNTAYDEGFKAAMQWRPIETAPKGKVLLYFPALHIGRLEEQPSMMLVHHVAGCRYRQPTHWMPLPDPPQEKG